MVEASNTGGDAWRKYLPLTMMLLAFVSLFLFGIKSKDGMLSNALKFVNKQVRDIQIDRDAIHVGVCVSGQLARWLPEKVLEPLIEANRDEHIQFHFFFNIQVAGLDNSNHTSVIYSTEHQITFHPTSISTQKSFSNIFEKIRSMYDTPNSRLEVLQFTPTVSFEDWKKSKLGELRYDYRKDKYLNATGRQREVHTHNKQHNVTTKLDRIYQYWKVQANILNMYLHQEDCYKQIVDFERGVIPSKNGRDQKGNTVFRGYKRTQKPFQLDYVISSREDIQYFQPLKIRKLIPLMNISNGHQLNEPNDHQIIDEHSNEYADNNQTVKEVDHSSHHKHRPCDFITKNCLSWHGVHMRWQIFPRKNAENIIGKRFDYYRYLQETNQYVYNPETYEKNQLEYYHMRICTVDYNYIPTIVARHVINDEVCYLKNEIAEQCIPEMNRTMVREKDCSKVNETFRLSVNDNGMGIADKTVNEIPHKHQNRKSSNPKEKKKAKDKQPQTPTPTQTQTQTQENESEETDNVQKKGKNENTKNTQKKDSDEIETKKVIFINTSKKQLSKAVLLSKIRNILNGDKNVDTGDLHLQGMTLNEFQALKNTRVKIEISIKWQPSS